MRANGSGRPSPGTTATRTVPHQLDLLTLLCGPASLAERFRAYHAAHPEVYAALVRLARQWVARTGQHRIGIAALYERARWELAIQTGESPSLNNSFRAFYARLIMAQESDLADLFETRRSAADSPSDSPPDRP